MKPKKKKIKIRKGCGLMPSRPNKNKKKYDRKKAAKDSLKEGAVIRKE